MWSLRWEAQDQCALLTLKIPLFTIQGREWEFPGGGLAVKQGPFKLVRSVFFWDRPLKWASAGQISCVFTVLSLFLWLSPHFSLTIEEASAHYHQKVFLLFSNNLHLVLLQAETWGSEDCLKVQSPALASNCKAAITKDLLRPLQEVRRKRKYVAYFHWSYLYILYQELR